MCNPPFKKIMIQREVFEEFEYKVLRKVSMFEALLGVMATSQAEITDGGENRHNPLVYQVGELGAKLLGEVCDAVFDSFEVGEADSNLQGEDQPTPDASTPEQRPAVPTYAIDAPTICDVFISDEVLAHLSDPERQDLLDRIWRRFAGRGWMMANHGPLEMHARLRRVEIIRRIVELLGRGGDLVKDIERRIDAAWE